MQEQKVLPTSVVFKPERESSLRDVLDVLFRYQKVIFLFFVVTVVSVTVLTFMTDEVYESKAKVFMRMGREVMSQELATLNGVRMAPTDIENYVNTEIDIITSDELAREVVNDPRFVAGIDTFLLPLDDLKEPKKPAAKKKVSFFRFLGLAPKVSREELALRAFQKNFFVEAIAQSNTLVLSYKGQSPEIAQQVLDVLLEHYKVRHTIVYESTATPSFFKELSDTSYSSYTLAAKKMQDYQDEYDLKDYEAQLANASAQYFGSLIDTETVRARFETTEGQIKAIEARIAARESILQNYSPVTELSRTVGRPNISIDNLKDRIAQMKIDRITLSKNFKETSLQIQNVNKRVEEAEALLAGENQDVAEVTTGINTAYDSLLQALDEDRTSLKGMLTLQEDLAAKLESYKTELDRLAGLKRNLANLRQQVEIANASYVQYNQSYRNALTDKGMDQNNVSNIKEIDGASKPTLPIRPRKLLNILTGIFLGLVGGFALAFLLDYLDDSFKTNEDVERRLVLPVLTTVPYSLPDAVSYSVAFKERPPVNQMPSVAGRNKEPL